MVRTANGRGNVWRPWRVRADADWQYYFAPRRALPDQGWKVHVSSSLADSASVLSRVSKICNDERWTFKHLRSAEALQAANEKDAPRTSSGKFVTIYPPQADFSPELVDRLASALADCHGPRILSDVQWRGSVVHLRYGAFVLLETWKGELALRAPGGTLEEDRREPVFSPPTWLDLPEWISDERLRNQALSHEELSRLRIDGAYSFSNAGGVYRARDSEGRAIVLKEGREGVSEHDGTDAADRVEHEYEVLLHLDATGLAPTARGTFRAAGSAFVMSGAVAGVPFNRRVVSGLPLTASMPDRAALRAHSAEVERVVADLRRVVDRLHDIGVTHGDIAPRNVLVGDAGAVRLVDFESASIPGAEVRSGVGTPGFTAPTGVEGPERDEFSIACLHLAALVPLTSLIPLDGRKLDAIATAAERWFPDAPVAALHDAIARSLPKLSRPRPRPRPAQVVWPPLPEPDQLDRTPGGVRGVLETAWLSGLSYADAHVLRRALPTTHRVDFEGGLAGIGVAALLADDVQGTTEIAEAVAERFLSGPERELPIEELPPGLIRGPSGVALFLAMFGQARADDAALDRAEALLRVDLDRLQPDSEDGLQIAQGGRLIPFLGSGSAGIGVVLAKLLDAGRDAAPVSILSRIVRAANPAFTTSAGLHDGRAGLVHLIIDVAACAAAELDPRLAAAWLDTHAEALELHRLSIDGGSSFPDQHLLRPDEGLPHGAEGVRRAVAAIERHRAGTATDRRIPSFLVRAGA